MKKERLVIKIDTDLKNKFSAKARAKGSNMTAELSRLIREYINENSKTQ